MKNVDRDAIESALTDMEVEQAERQAERRAMWDEWNHEQYLARVRDYEADLAARRDAHWEYEDELAGTDIMFNGRYIESPDDDCWYDDYAYDYEPRDDWAIREIS